MKTKIVYISGNEIFDMRDIRAAFNEVRNALNLGKDTVLFGVPVDQEDAGIMPDTTPSILSDAQPAIVKDSPVLTDEYTYEKSGEEIVVEPTEPEMEIESVAEEKPKKRGRPRKENIVEDDIEPIIENAEPTSDTPEAEEKVVPVFSVLSATDDSTKDIDIIPDVSNEKTETIEDLVETEDITTATDDEIGLEKLLSAMTPLQEDVSEKQKIKNTVPEPDDDEISVDVTLEQLATEFAENQDKIVSESKSSTRSKIGKLRNILPFKQSKHKDQGLGDLFGWAGVAANDEEFSVPGFFTNAAAKK